MPSLDGVKSIEANLRIEPFVAAITESEFGTQIRTSTAPVLH